MSHRSTNSDIKVQRHAVILCHPADSSFNGAVARTYCETVRSLGHEADLRDLYRLGFDPVLRADERPGAAEFVQATDVGTEIECIRGADALVLVYPIWFGTPPAMMKGYVDRVLGAGFSHRDVQAQQPHPFLSGKHLVSITSSGTSSTWLHLHGAWMPLRDVFDRYIANAFSMASNEHLHLESINENMDESRTREELRRVEELATATCARLTGTGRQADGKTSTVAR